MKHRLSYYFVSGLWGAILPYLLLPIALFLIGTYLSGSPPNMDLRSSSLFVLRLLSEPSIYFAPFAASWFGWRTQNRRVAYYNGVFFSLLILTQILR